MKFLKQIIVILLITLCLGILVLWYVQNKMSLHQKSGNTTVVLEQIHKVTKLVTVEGQFSEIYDHKEYYKYDIFDLFTKKMLLRINAKVSAGFNLEGSNMTIDSISKTVYFTELPKAEILSIDHDIDYYDISQGVFASFTPEEYTSIDKDAKEMIASKVQFTDLLKKADEQKQEYLDMLELILRTYGWKLVIKGKSYPLQ
ncbi:MAG: DUF4230 domain-containing protein [Lewinellaceae bacterium]|nr:DUF4230 domain-containing protein [Lewinellaceae bacterium]